MLNRACRANSFCVLCVCVCVRERERVCVCMCIALKYICVRTLNHNIHTTYMYVHMYIVN